MSTRPSVSGLNIGISGSEASSQQIVARTLLFPSALIATQRHVPSRCVDAPGNGSIGALQFVPSSSDQLINVRCARLPLAGAKRKPASQRPLGRTQMLGKHQLAASVLGRLAN